VIAEMLIQLTVETDASKHTLGAYQIVISHHATAGR